jgi:cytochrome P450
MNLIEKAVRNKFRFASVIGQLTVEQVMDLPLTAKTGASLETLAREALAEVRKMQDDVLLSTDSRQAQQNAVDKLEILKSLIAEKQDLLRMRAEAKDRAAKREQLMEVLAAKQRRGLEDLSEEALLKQIEALSK